MPIQRTGVFDRNDYRIERDRGNIKPIPQEKQKTVGETIKSGAKEVGRAILNNACATAKDVVTGGIAVSAAYGASYKTNIAKGENPLAAKANAQFTAALTGVTLAVGKVMDAGLGAIDKAMKLGDRVFGEFIEKRSTSPSSERSIGRESRRDR